VFEVPLFLRKRTDGIGSLSNAGEAGSEAADASDGVSSIEHAYVRGVIDFLFEEEDGWVREFKITG
jgi:ATP-dependent helicase/nuclease subunit A